HAVALNLIGNVDKFILLKYFSLIDVGLYTFAFSIGSTMMFVFISISVYMEPLIYKSKDLNTREKYLYQYNFISTGLGILGYLGIYVLSGFIIPAIYGDRYDIVLKYIPLISMCYIIYPY